MEAALKRKRSGYGYVRAFDHGRADRDLESAQGRPRAPSRNEGRPQSRSRLLKTALSNRRDFPEFFVRFRDVIHKYDTSAGYYGHASVGCLHIRPLINTKDAKDIRIMQDMTDEIADLVIEFGGGMSGEHGDGLARSHLNEKLFGTATV